MQNQINLTIEHLHENGQSYYVATSPDIQGLVAEADTIDAVIEIAKDLIPILMELDEPPTKPFNCVLSPASRFQIPLVIS